MLPRLACTSYIFIVSVMTACAQLPHTGSDFQTQNLTTAAGEIFDAGALIPADMRTNLFQIFGAYSFTEVDQILRSQSTNDANSQTIPGGNAGLAQLSATSSTLAHFVAVTQIKPLDVDRATFLNTLVNASKGVAPTSLMAAKNYSAAGIYLSLLQAYSMFLGASDQQGPSGGLALVTNVAACAANSVGRTKVVSDAFKQWMTQRNTQLTPLGRGRIYTNPDRFYYDDNGGPAGGAGTGATSNFAIDMKERTISSTMIPTSARDHSICDLWESDLKPKFDSLNLDPFDSEHSDVLLSSLVETLASRDYIDARYFKDGPAD